MTTQKELVDNYEISSLEAVAIGRLADFLLAGGDVNQEDIFCRDMFTEAMEMEMYTLASMLVHSGAKMRTSTDYSNPQLIMQIGSIPLMKAYKKDALEKYGITSEDINRAFANIVYKNRDMLRTEKYEFFQNIVTIFGINPNEVSFRDENIVFYAVNTYSIGLLSLLLDNGLNKDIKHSNGQTLLDYAKEYHEKHEFSKGIRVLTQSLVEKLQHN